MMSVIQFWNRRDSVFRESKGFEVNLKTKLKETKIVKTSLNHQNASQLEY